MTDTNDAIGSGNGNALREGATPRGRKGAGPARDAAPKMSSTVATAYRAMVENAPINVIVIDREMVIRYANAQSISTLRRLEQYLPIRAEQLIGNTVDIFHKNPAHQRRLLSDRSRLPHTARIQVGPEHLELRVVAIEDEGAYVGAMLTWDIVTEKVRSEAEVARQASMLENLPINLMYCDRELIIRYQNPASANTLRTLQQYLPVRVDQIVGQSVDVFHKNPMHQRRLLGDPSNLPHAANIQVGPRRCGSTSARCVTDKAPTSARWSPGSSSPRRSTTSASSRRRRSASAPSRASSPRRSTPSSRWCRRLPPAI
jgi:methyl-accepting chemotaxis protein